MPNVTITVGGRDFEVACQEGEEHYLKAAAGHLDTEASAVAAQIGRLPEPRMLLMAGLMLADKMAGTEEQLRYRDEQIANLENEINSLRSKPDPEPRTVEVPVVPEEVSQTLAELAARAEAIAEQVEERASG